MTDSSQNGESDPALSRAIADALSSKDSSRHRWAVDTLCSMGPSSSGIIQDLVQDERGHRTRSRLTAGLSVLIAGTLLLTELRSSKVDGVVVILLLGWLFLAIVDLSTDLFSLRRQGLAVVLADMASPAKIDLLLDVSVHQGLPERFLASLEQTLLQIGPEHGILLADRHHDALRRLFKWYRPELIFAAISALEHVGTLEDVGTLHRVLDGYSPYSTRPEFREAADLALRAIEARSALPEPASTLLRPAEEPTASLLRPAVAQPSDPAQLLRVETSNPDGSVV